VSTMGAAARLDPTRIRVADLAETRVDPFARDLRRGLRRKHGMDCTRRLGVTAIYSEEPPQSPRPLAYDDGAFRCVCPGGDNGVNDCERKNRIEGSVAFVPSVFGMTAAGVAVKMLLGLPVTSRARDSLAVTTAPR
jgi:tRNA threonylcarbamoyladenosine dehydratase